MASTDKPRKLHPAYIAARQIGGETLLYNERTHTAWCLNRISACVWRLCDGRTAVSSIAAAASAELASPIDEGLIQMTLEELRAKRLLEAARVRPSLTDPSRRAMLGKAGLAAAALLPVVLAISAPPAVAQSGSVGTGGARRVRRARPTQPSS